MTELPRNGEIWWCEPPQLSRRPAVVMSRNHAIEGTGRVMVAPCSTRVRGLPTEVLLEPGEDPVIEACCVQLDGVTSVSVAELTGRLGILSPDRNRSVCAALEVAVNCP
ncbi:MAG: type II toxin-antitoxin system PemK/MazF family toxin [Acidimicrobiaceae bacterium]|nr:type II toxin-antitoxin system PemK/MazF family toxin [Acidimicrobiaceae bacterium]